MSTLTSAAQLATAGGTLVLAVATYQSVRSANRSTRIAEQAMSMGMQPVLVNSRPEDPPERVTFIEGVVMEAPGGTALVERHDDGHVFIVVPLRNVGPGLAVLRAGHVAVAQPGDREPPRGVPYRPLSRDLFVPPGDRGFWQIGIRDDDDPFRPAVEQAIRDRDRLSVTLLYTDHLGGHRAKTQFSLVPQDDGVWHCSVVRHWGIADTEP